MRERLDELLVSLLERIESEKAPLVARAFSGLVGGELAFHQFSRYADVIAGCNLIDLRTLYLAHHPNVPGRLLTVEIARRLESFGLVDAQRPAGAHHQNAKTGQVDLSEIPVTVTPFGERAARRLIRPEDVTKDEGVGESEE